MNYKVINGLGETIGYVVNSPSESDAQKMGSTSFPDEYFDVRESTITGVPSMFVNSAMDARTLALFVLPQPARLQNVN
jgi:hypothetical protein